MSHLRVHCSKLIAREYHEQAKATAYNEGARRGVALGAAVLHWIAADDTDMALAILSALTDLKVADEFATIVINHAQSPTVQSLKACADEVILWAMGNHS